MTWDPVWEETYRARDWGRYPPEELVRFVARHYYGVPDRSAVRVLEVGCGAGANLWYLAREGFDVYGIDGSETAIRKAWDRLLEDDLDCGMSTHLLTADASHLRSLFWPMYEFDAVIDVCCLQHNRLNDTRAILEQAYAVLKPGGRVFSMMVATGSWGDGLGAELEPHTYVSVPEGPAKGMGLTRFTTHRGVLDLFARFEDVDITLSSRTMNGLCDKWDHWVIEGRKAG